MGAAGAATAGAGEGAEPVTAAGVLAPVVVAAVVVVVATAGFAAFAAADFEPAFGKSSRETTGIPSDGAAAASGAAAADGSAMGAVGAFAATEETT